MGVFVRGLPVAALLACGPSAFGSETSESSGGDDGDAIAACAAFDDDFDGCREAPDCQYYDNRYAIGPSCQVDIEWEGRCLPRGDAFEGGRRAFYRRDGDRLDWVLAEQWCSYLDAEVPGFTECGRGDNDPAECACFCQGDVCPWEAEHQAMLACEIPSPCGVYMPNGDQPGLSAVETCMLTALRDRELGNLHVDLNLGDFGRDSWVHILYSGDAWRNGYDWSFGDCRPPAWEPLERCTLKDPSFFEACLASQDPAEQMNCMDPAQWMQSCVVQGPACE